jgi:hypothetical protein
MRLTRVDQRVCGHCERRDVGSVEGGYGNAGGVALCRPSVSGRPNCFLLVTVYGHPACACRCGSRSLPCAGPRDAAISRLPRHGWIAHVGT